MAPTAFGLKVCRQSGGIGSGDGGEFWEETCGNKSFIAHVGPGVRQDPPLNVLSIDFYQQSPSEVMGGWFCGLLAVQALLTLHFLPFFSSSVSFAPQTMKLRL